MVCSSKWKKAVSGLSLALVAGVSVGAGVASLAGKAFGAGVGSAGSQAFEQVYTQIEDLQKHMPPGAVIQPFNSVGGCRIQMRQGKSLGSVVGRITLTKVATDEKFELAFVERNIKYASGSGDFSNTENLARFVIRERLGDSQIGEAAQITFFMDKSSGVIVGAKAVRADKSISDAFEDGYVFAQKLVRPIQGSRIDEIQCGHTAGEGESAAQLLYSYGDYR